MLVLLINNACLQYYFNNSLTNFKYHNHEENLFGHDSCHNDDGVMCP